MAHPFGEQGPDQFVSVGNVEDWVDQQVKEVKVHKKPMPNVLRPRLRWQAPLPMA